MSAPSIAAVVINHKSAETAIKVIESLFQQEVGVHKIVLVDDHSQDEGVDRIQELFPDVQVVSTPENVGLSRARNIGLDHISTDLVLFIDDDVYLSRNALAKMIKALSRHSATAVCPRIVLHPQNDILQCDGAWIHFSGTLALRHAFQPVSLHPPSCSDANAFIGACLLFDRKKLLDLGGFDEDYVFYFEDLELSYRLQALGRRIICEKNPVAFHERGEGTASLSFRGKGSYPRRRAYLNLRNRWRTMSIHYQTRTLLLLAPALLLYEGAALIECIRRGWILLWFKALFSLLAKFDDILKRRRRWQASRKVSDGFILQGGPLPFAAGFASNDTVAGFIQMLDQLLNVYWGFVKRWL